jgi:hypothetical protein
MKNDCNKKKLNESLRKSKKKMEKGKAAERGVNF